MEIIASSLMAAGVPSIPPAASGASVVSEGAAARFAELMAADAPTAVEASAQRAVVSAPVDGAGGSLGERILAGLNGASSAFQQSLTQVTTILDAGQATRPADLLRMQLNLTQVSIQYDLIGKAISRTTQNIDQMVKIQ